MPTGHHHSDDEGDERMSAGFSYQRREDGDHDDDDERHHNISSVNYTTNNNESTTTRQRGNAGSHQTIDHAPFGVDRVPGMEPLNHPGALRRESFIADFASSKGPPQIVLLVMLLALGFGSTIGVVPAVMSDRYARINHGYGENDKSCSDYVNFADKPQACLDGSADAQTGVATEQLIANVFTFFTSSLVGSLSDEHGRKGILVAGLLLSTLSPLSLVLLQLSPTMSPNWYYAAGAITGLINWTTVALSSLGDVMPPKWRAPSFGLLLAGFSLGFALAPQLAIVLGHFGVSVFALITVVLSLLVTIFSFPETLQPEQAAEARDVRRSIVAGMTRSQRIVWNIKRPVWELSILNRNRLFRLLSLLAFFSGMVTSGDRTLIIYYIEERLGFNDQDIATMFLIMGILGTSVDEVDARMSFLCPAS
jgi:MFS family permease